MQLNKHRVLRTIGSSDRQQVETAKRSERKKAKNALRI